MHLLISRLRDSVYRSGLICIGISLFFFCLPFYRTINEDRSFALFVPSFAMTWVYFIVLLVSRKRSEPENKIHYTFLFLTLFLISAYALNREMSVFENSAEWFSALLVASSVNFLAFSYAEVFPKWVVHTMTFISGISWVAFLYLSLYLMPIYFFGAIGVLLLGFSLHAFVPALYVIYSFRLLNQVAQNNKKYWWSFLAGLAAAIAVVVTYAAMWNRTKIEIDNAWYNSHRNKMEIPTWVSAAQTMPDNFFSQKLLRTGLVYTVPRQTGFDFFGMSGRRFNEPKKHDPLVLASVFLAGDLSLTDDEKIMLLRSRFNYRHETLDRLWSGDHLVTENVNTEVRFWPQCNITYTEKTLTVSNQNKDQPWRRQEEAIYTFYMPEGAVVTALSLWINGNEEKSVLTTKEKADLAYKTVVGVESRDPSVVHWQEGNTVSVRVFPVLAGESRKFKIGITSPLERVNGKLRYENIYFKGPSFDDARENILIDFEQPVNDFQLPAMFTSMSRQSYKRQGRYEPRWNMIINDPGLSGCAFSFDGNTYSTSAYHQKLSPANFQKIYLDVNKAWSRDDFNKILDLSVDHEIFVYDSIIRRLDATNQEEIWEHLHSLQFSLFPLFEIKEPAISLLITKNKMISPSIDDLGTGRFIENTKSFLSDGQKIKLFDLGEDLSPYLKTFKEFRVFQYDRGDARQLEDLLRHNYFPDDTENDNQIIIHRSDMIIQKTKGMSPSSGPDHMMRLFTYNHIMQQLGRGQLLGNMVEDSIIDEARKAYVVTPVSSLVVLETQDDYKRFDINGNGESLANASLQSKGAVPEPHEWVIIILAASLVIYLRWRNPKTRYS